MGWTEAQLVERRKSDPAVAHGKPTGKAAAMKSYAASPPAEMAVPYTKGVWEPTPPDEVTLVKGPNVLNFDIKPGSRGVTIKDFTLTPVK